MNATEFCYWLQGYMELQPEGKLTGLSAEQMKMIAEHLQVVFQKVTQAADRSMYGLPSYWGSQQFCQVSNIEPGTSC